MSQSTAEHRAAAKGKTARCCVLTISDTRTEETDKGGRLIIESLNAAGHKIEDYSIVPDEPEQISTQLDAWLHIATFGDCEDEQGQPAPCVDVIITTGGTGIARRDTTIEVARRFLDKELEGFGELFRMLSYEEVGPAAILSRAVAGLSNETLIFCLPGSTNAVKLALDKLIVPELPHLIWERKR